MKLSTNTESQRKRILDYLQKNRAMTTLQARTELDVFHPAARVQELKARGHDIVTHLRDIHTEMGIHKAVAEYVLMKINHDAV